MILLFISFIALVIIAPLALGNLVKSGEEWPVKGLIGLSLIALTIYYSYLLGFGTKFVQIFLWLLFIVSLLKSRKHFLTIKNKFKQCGLVLAFFSFFLINAWIEIMATSHSVGDSHAIWYPRVMAIFYGHSFEAMKKWVVYPQYPFAGTALWAYWPLVGNAPVEIGRASYAALMAFYAAALSMRIRSAHWLLATIGTFWIFIQMSRSFFLTGYQDPVAMTIIASLLFCLVRGKGDSIVALFGIFGSLIKAEAGVFSMIFLVAYGCFEVLEKKPKNAAKYFLLGMACLIVWPICLHLFHLNATDLQGNSFQLTPTIFVENLGRLKVIVPRLLSDFGFLGALFGFLLLAIAYFKKEYRFIVLGLFTSCVAITVMFLATTQPLVWHIDTAMSRLTLQLKTALYTITIIPLVDFLNQKMQAYNHETFVSRTRL